MSDKIVLVPYSNTRIWDVLGKTNPSQTKGFTRSGGFKGTAIKPMWCNRRMTEYFGPCGIGWGPDEPLFNVQAAGEEILVFCTCGLWYKDPDTKERGQVFGVGGDKILTKGKDYLRTSDEAFKSAYTDALSNAMKLIGVAADVHMGLFEDSKYLKEIQAEFDAAERPSPQPKRITKSQRDAFIAEVKKNGLENVVKDKLKKEGFESSGEITDQKYLELMAWAGESINVLD